MKIFFEIFCSIEDKIRKELGLKSVDDLSLELYLASGNEKNINQIRDMLKNRRFNTKN